MIYKILTKEESSEVMEIADDLKFDAEVDYIDEKLSIGLSKKQWKQIEQVQRMRRSYQIS